MKGEEGLIRRQVGVPLWGSKSRQGVLYGERPLNSGRTGYEVGVEGWTEARSCGEEVDSVNDLGFHSERIR